MKRRLALLVACLAIVSAACGAAYENQPLTFGNPLGIQVRPTFAAVSMQYVETGVIPSNARCAFSLTAAGAGAVVAIGATFAPPVGVTAWAVFGGVFSAVGLGDALENCWNRYVITKPAWEVVIQCPVNHPTLVSTFDDYGEAIAYVDMKYCFCSLACQFGMADAPGMPFSMFAMQAGKNYFHAGANRLEGPVTEEPPPPPPPPDFHAIADGLGMEYTGCDGVGVFQPSALTPAVCQ